MFQDLNFSPPTDHQEAIHEEEVVDQGEAIRRNAVNLANEQRFGVYFALRVIKNRHGDICPEDKQLIAILLNTSV